MREAKQVDAVIVGSGPNGLAAAITLARAGRSVLVLEGKEEIGGGMRTMEYTLPGFRHDVCSAVHPLGVGSPFFRDLPLADFGLEWVFPDLPLVHLLDDRAVALHRSLDRRPRSWGQTATPTIASLRRWWGSGASCWTCSWGRWACRAGRC
jgi:phytoene dehydrogenase-like protein